MLIQAYFEVPKLKSYHIISGWNCGVVYLKDGATFRRARVSLAGCPLGLKLRTANDTVDLEASGGCVSNSFSGWRGLDD